MSLSFAVTFDYRCPFARNAHEHVVTGLAAGADWDVTFTPFSLGQVHVAEGEQSIWERPHEDVGLLALQAGTVVRDRFPQQFPTVHRALFAARHDEGLHIEDPDVVRGVLSAAEVPADEVFASIDDGSALKQVQLEHEQAAATANVWGVPTFISGEDAVFVRLMNRPTDPAESIRAIERVVDLLTGWADLNEFKHTSIPK